MVQIGKEVNSMKRIVFSFIFLILVFSLETAFAESKSEFTCGNASIEVPNTWVQWHDGGMAYAAVQKGRVPHLSLMATSFDGEMNIKSAEGFFLDLAEEELKSLSNTTDYKSQRIAVDGSTYCTFSYIHKNGMAMMYGITFYKNNNLVLIVYTDGQEESEKSKEKLMEYVKTLKLYGEAVFQNIDANDLLGKSAEKKKEKTILFRNTPWGISYTEADKLFPEYKLSSWLTGEYMKFYPIEQLITGKYSDKVNFEYHDINIPADCSNDEFEVAGYKTTDITLHFAYKVIDGVITHKEEDTLFYGAQYEFEPADSKFMIDDLKKKLSSLYGEIDEDGNRSVSNIWKYEWWIWKGADNTAVSLTWEYRPDGKSKDKVWISYFTYKGDEWLRAASDGEKERLIREERNAADNGGLNGL